MVCGADVAVEFDEEFFKMEDGHGGVAEDEDDGLEGVTLRAVAVEVAGFDGEAVQGAADVF